MIRQPSVRNSVCIGVELISMSMKAFCGSSPSDVRLRVPLLQWEGRGVRAPSIAGSWSLQLRCYHQGKAVL